LIQELKVILLATPSGVADSQLTRTRAGPPQPDGNDEQAQANKLQTGKYDGAPVARW